MLVTVEVKLERKSESSPDAATDWTFGERVPRPRRTAACGSTRLGTVDVLPKTATAAALPSVLARDTHAPEKAEG